MNISASGKMTLQELQDTLARDPRKLLRLRLPQGDPVPVSFHITEVGEVTKEFIDCGGTRRSSKTCQLQAWVGPDGDHRLDCAKLLGILRKGASLFQSLEVPVEIEYEAGVLSQYPVTAAAEEEGHVVLFLGTKHTDCLAKELCIPRLAVPAMFQSAFSTSPAGTCCGPGGCD